MINKEMNTYKSNNQGTQNRPATAKPNEVTGIYFSSGIKIFDPNTKEIILHKRGDS